MADQDNPSAAPFVPAGADLDALRDAAKGCRGCDLYRDATQTVFGRGNSRARIAFIGEQPGDQEDRKGLPFVGPAGHLLRRAVDDAGMDAASLYITNAVKHFKFTSSGPGGRRLHRTPDRIEVRACQPWLIAELSLLRPEAVVVLGATAAGSLLGPAFRVTRSRGQVLPWPGSAQDARPFATHTGAFLVATIHPSAVLRADDRDEAYAGLVRDLRVVTDRLKSRPRG